MIDLWMEGYAATGEHKTAELCGTYDTDSIEVAVKEWYASYKSKYPNSSNTLLKQQKDGTWAFWGMRFFDNESDARKVFG